MQLTQILLLIISAGLFLLTLLLPADEITTLLIGLAALSFLVALSLLVRSNPPKFITSAKKSKSKQPTSSWLEFNKQTPTASPNLPSYQTTSASEQDAPTKPSDTYKSLNPKIKNYKTVAAAESFFVNPATGLPMLGGIGGLDVAGNSYGSRSNSSANEPRVFNQATGFNRTNESSSETSNSSEDLIKQLNTARQQNSSSKAQTAAEALINEIASHLNEKTNQQLDTLDELESLELTEASSINQDSLNSGDAFSEMLHNELASSDSFNSSDSND